jgi:hypothetical protein
MPRPPRDPQVRRHGRDRRRDAGLMPGLSVAPVRSHLPSAPRPALGRRVVSMPGLRPLVRGRLRVAPGRGSGRQVAMPTGPVGELVRAGARSRRPRRPTVVRAVAGCLRSGPRRGHRRRGVGSVPRLVRGCSRRTLDWGRRRRGAVPMSGLVRAAVRVGRPSRRTRRRLVVPAVAGCLRGAPGWGRRRRKVGRMPGLARVGGRSRRRRRVRRPQVGLRLVGGCPRRVARQRPRRRRVPFVVTSVSPR